MKCVHCKRDAGFLKRRHKQCRDQYEIGIAQITDLTTDAALGRRPRAGLVADLKQIASTSYVPDEDVAGLMAQAWMSSLNAILDDRLLTTAEQAQFEAYLREFGFLRNAFQSLEGGREALERLRQAEILRDLANGKIPDRRLWNHVGVPFNLMKSESLVYAFSDVRYFEDKTKREQVGGSMGTSVRVMSGVYVRNSTFRSRTEEKEVTEHVDTGVLGLTTKHIYFSGQRKKFRVRYDKIVAFDYYRDGLGITRDALTARPQKFLVGSERGWFTSNLVYLLADQG